jgi:hypothetical protein
MARLQERSAYACSLNFTPRTLVFRVDFGERGNFTFVLKYGEQCALSAKF